MVCVCVCVCGEGGGEQISIVPREIDLALFAKIEL